MTEVAIAMIECGGRWLLQLRDDMEGIVHPGTWALFGGHLDPGETPQQALIRELEEEINWRSAGLPAWFVHHDSQRIAHFFKGSLDIPFSELQLLEGQDMVLASVDELRSGLIWSPKCQQKRRLAPTLQRAVLELNREHSWS